jgi:tetratricopeptide (TPR) repeat protein
MKKQLLITISLLAVIFAAITLWKSRSNPAQTTPNALEKSLLEKEKIRQFWEEYRTATEYRIDGHLERAMEKYQAALKLNEHHEDALYYLGNMHLKLNQLEEAKNAWQRLAEVNPASTRAYIQLGNLYLRHEEAALFNIDSAEAAFQQALKINSEESGTSIGMGQIALLKEQWNEARKYFDDVLKSNFKSVEACFANGYVAWKTGNHPEALAMFTKAVEHARPQDSPAKVSGEGDTKAGNMLGETRYASLFQNFVFELREVDEQQLPREMEVRYREFDAFLNQIKKMKSGGNKTPSPVSRRAGVGINSGYC